MVNLIKGKSVRAVQGLKFKQFCSFWIKILIPLDYSEATFEQTNLHPQDKYDKFTEYMK